MNHGFPVNLRSPYCSVFVIGFSFFFQFEEQNGEEEEQEETQDEGQEEAVVVDVDSTDGTVLVNGNEADEEWGTNNEGNPSA